VAEWPSGIPSHYLVPLKLKRAFWNLFWNTVWNNILGQAKGSNLVENGCHFGATLQRCPCDTGVIYKSEELAPEVNYAPEGVLTGKRWWGFSSLVVLECVWCKGVAFTCESHG